MAELYLVFSINNDDMGELQVSNDYMTINIFIKMLDD